MVKSIVKDKKGNPEIPSDLVRDVIDGEPFYYKGYRDVLNEKKTIEEIIGKSTLQSVIISYFFNCLFREENTDIYHLFPNIRLHFSNLSYYSTNLAVFDIATLPFEKIDEHYANVPPVLVVEVDVKMDTKHLTEEEFVQLKTRSLLKHGAGKFIWITSKNKQVLIAEKDKEWIEQSWYEPFELLNGIQANPGDYLRKKGVPAAQ